MVGAALVILTGRHAPGRPLTQIDWPLLLFFACLFVVIEGVNSTGILDAAHARIAPAFGTTAASQATALAGFSVAMSNVVSNVPFVAVAQHWMEGFEAPGLMWHVLAMSSTFAGNLTIVGSVANMIVLEASKDRASVGFREYLKTGVPVTRLRGVFSASRIEQALETALPEDLQSRSFAELRVALDHA